MTGMISYREALAQADWSTDEVISCWLLEQQGIGDDVIASFRDSDLDENKLVDVGSFFTESFVQESSGITAKIARKKLVVAAKRLRTMREGYPVGMELDSNDEYPILVGPAGKVIRGMKIGVASMAVGEMSLLRIRSDYGHGSEGYRKLTGEIVIPPFATLEFEIKVNSISS